MDLQKEKKTEAALLSVMVFINALGANSQFFRTYRSSNTDA